MSETVRTSITDRPSSNRIDDLTDERERKRLDNLPLVLDEDSAMVRRECGHDVLSFQSTEDEILGAVEFDATVGIHLADERDAALGDRQIEVSPGIEMLIEIEGGWEMTKCGPEPVAELAGKAGAVIGCPEASIRLFEVVVAEESFARAAQGPKIRTGMTEHPRLPDRIEAFDSGVAAGFFRGNEAKLDAQQKMEPDDLRDTVAIPSPSRRGHLVVHLGDSGKPHNLPGINQMTAERDRSLIADLAGRSGLSGDVDGVDGVEAGDSRRTAEMTGPDQVGLLKVAHLTGRDVGIGRPVGGAFGLGLFRSSGAGQDLFDGRDGGKPADAPSLKLEMDRFGADAGKSGATGLVGRQFVAQDQDFPDQGLPRLMRDMSRRPTLVAKPIKPEFSMAMEPFGEPKAAPMDGAEDFVKPNPIIVIFNGFLPSLIFALDAHRKDLLPTGMGKSISNEQIAYRCPYGYSLSDVLMGTP